jgi:endonuclease/exonuclease/phosphatase (EEP) superfamily protein YafD
MKTPTLIAGDFNAVSWSHTVRQIEEASNTKVVEGMRWTIELKKQVPLIPNFKLAIDHLLLSSEFQVEEIFVEKDLGSDHLLLVSVIRY